MKKNNHQSERIEGRHVNLREVTVADAEFILELRLSDKAKVLHATDPDVEKQREYIRSYLLKDFEWYWVVEDKNGNRLGCISIYDVNGDSVRSGRWVMKTSAAPNQSIESDLLMRDFAFDVLCAKDMKSDTRHENKRVQRYLEMTGYLRTGEDSDEIFYCMDRARYYEIGRPYMRRFCGGK